MGRDQGLDLLKQEACDVKSEEQRFTCKKNKIMPVKDSGLCVTTSGNCFTIFYLPLRQNHGNGMKSSFIYKEMQFFSKKCLSNC